MRKAPLPLRVGMASACLVTASFALPALLSACGSSDGEPSGTTGKRVVLHTRIALDAAAKAPFTTGFGWRVTLDAAAVDLAALYYFDGEPAFVRNERRLPSWRGWLAPREAHAHPGHYQAGNAMGQMLTPSSWDLFSPSAALGDGDGISGTYRSARFVFASTPQGPAAGALAGHVAVARGTAERVADAASAPIHFAIDADFADVAKSAASGAIEGCVFDEANVASDGTVTLTLVPTVWFDLVDFSDVAPGSAAAPTTVPHGDKAQIGFALGLAQLTAYRFAYSP